MSESRQPSEAEAASSCHQNQAPSVPGVRPVQIILTPPTPIDGNAGSSRHDEDTHKEVAQLNNIIKEKEVHVRQEVPDEKQVYSEDEKEVHSPGVQATQAQHVDTSDKELYHPRPSGDGVEKEVCRPQTWPVQAGHADMVENEDHDSRPHVVGSGQSVETQDDEDQARAQASIVQRQLNSVSVAVEKRKKALSTFTTLSNSRMREGYARMEQSVTDRGVAIERGANNRFTRLEKGFNDQINRAGKRVNARVTSLKQSVSGIKKVGSRKQGNERESERESESRWSD